MGAGQESTAILFLLANDQIFYERYITGKLLVIMSDTGDEHQATYQHVQYLVRFCNKHGFEFHFITSKMGFHPATWPGLVEWMMKYNGIMSVAYPKSCTVNLKIIPIYNFLEAFVAIHEFGIKGPIRKTRKKYLKLYCSSKGKINVLLGLAKGEEGRVSVSEPVKWMSNCINRIYPLIDIGFNRLKCQQYILSLNLPLPPPSNCLHCPYLSEIELLWLFRNHPDKYKEWVRLERNKINKWTKLGLTKDKNFGVFGLKLLPEVLAFANRKYGHLTTEELLEYKMSHGHCVLSKY